VGAPVPVRYVTVDTGGKLYVPAYACMCVYIHR